MLLKYFELEARFPDGPDDIPRRAADYVAHQIKTHPSELANYSWSEHCDDLNRLAASKADGLVAPSMLVSKLQGLRRQNSLQQAIQELGRLAKTRHLLAYVDDPALRRRVLAGLNRQERVHALARAIFFGRQARFPERSYDAQLDRASALSIAINAIVVWNTRYLAAAADHLAREGRPVPDSAWSHLSPLHWEHVHLVGRYSFSELRLGNRLRPLRSHGAAHDTPRRLVG